MIASRLRTLAVLLAAVALLGAQKPPRVPLKPEQQTVKLPNGKVISPALMRYDRKQVDAKIHDETNTGHEGPRRREPRRLLQTAQGNHTYRGGELDGTSIYLDRKGAVLAVVKYAAGKRIGPLQLWDGDEPRLYVDYKAGVKNGLQVYYTRGIPVIAEHFEAGQQTATYLIEQQGDELIARPSFTLDDRQRKILLLCQGDAEDKLAQFAKREGQLKSQIKGR
jgi:hypothetical protein